MQLYLGVFVNRPMAIELVTALPHGPLQTEEVDPSVSVPVHRLAYADPQLQLLSDPGR